MRICPQPTLIAAAAAATSADTNFINFSIQNKLELHKAMMDCLFAKCIPCITDCVMAELEKLGRKFRLAMKIARDPRTTRLTCQHKGTYADDCECEAARARCTVPCARAPHVCRGRAKHGGGGGDGVSVGVRVCLALHVPVAMLLPSPRTL